RRRDHFLERAPLPRQIFEPPVDGRPHLARLPQFRLADVGAAMPWDDAGVRVAYLVELIEGSGHARQRPADGVVDHRITSRPEQIAGLDDVGAREEDERVAVS